MRFSELRFPVHKHKGDLAKAIPEFSRSKIITEFKHKQKDLIIKYGVFMYDKGSPYTHEFKNLFARRNEIATTVGFRRNAKNEWSKFVQDLMRWEDDSISKVFLEIIKLQNEALWAHRIMLENNYWENYERLMEPIERGEDEKKAIDAQALKDKLRVSNKSMIEEMAIIDRELFGDDNEGIKKSKQIRLTNPFAIASAYR